MLELYKKQINELLFTNTIFTKQVLVDWKQYTCYMPIANDLLGYDRASNESVDGSKDLLKPLNNMCAYYTTRQFLYEICFGKHVRQFDDAFTIQNMAKEKP